MCKFICRQMALLALSQTVRYRAGGPQVLRLRLRSARGLLLKVSSFDLYITNTRLSMPLASSWMLMTAAEL